MRNGKVIQQMEMQQRVSIAKSSGIVDMHKTVDEKLMADVRTIDTGFVQLTGTMQGAVTDLNFDDSLMEYHKDIICLRVLQAINQFQEQCQEAMSLRMTEMLHNTDKHFRRKSS